MRKQPFACLIAAVVLLAASTSASAQLFRAYLSIDGSDANPCTLVQPCRLLPAALAAVTSGGEIWMLDSANYNVSSITVAKSVTILAVPGALGSLVSLGGLAVAVSSAGLSVTLRNINVRPVLGEESSTGVFISANSALRLVNCSIFGFNTGYGLYGVAGWTSVADSEFRDNGRGAHFEGGANAAISGSQFANSFIGVESIGANSNTTTVVTVSRSTSSNNTWGFIAEVRVINSHANLHVSDSTIEGATALAVGARNPAPTAGATATVTIANSFLVNNAEAVQSLNSGATVFATGNTIANNTVAFQATGGVLESPGNNSVRNNAGVGSVPTLVGSM